MALLPIGWIGKLPVICRVLGGLVLSILPRQKEEL